VALWEDYRPTQLRRSRAGIFTCPHCGAVYELTFTRVAATDSNRAICAKCRKVMKEWNDDFARSFRLKKG
jgi:ribosomal protein L37AE/L43A